MDYLDSAIIDDFFKANPDFEKPHNAIGLATEVADVVYISCYLKTQTSIDYTVVYDPGLESSPDSLLKTKDLALSEDDYWSDFNKGFYGKRHKKNDGLICYSHCEENEADFIHEGLGGVLVVLNKTNRSILKVYYFKDTYSMDARPEFVDIVENQIIVRYFEYNYVFQNGKFTGLTFVDSYKYLKLNYLWIAYPSDGYDASCNWHLINFRENTEHPIYALTKQLGEHPSIQDYTECWYDFERKLFFFGSETERIAMDYETLAVKEEDIDKILCENIGSMDGICKIETSTELKPIKHRTATIQESEGTRSLWNDAVTQVSILKRIMYLVASQFPTLTREVVHVPFFLTTDSQSEPSIRTYLPIPHLYFKSIPIDSFSETERQIINLEPIKEHFDTKVYDELATLLVSLCYINPSVHIFLLAGGDDTTESQRCLTYIKSFYYSPLLNRLKGSMIDISCIDNVNSYSWSVDKNRPSYTIDFTTGRDLDYGEFLYYSNKNALNVIVNIISNESIIRAFSTPFVNWLEDEEYGSECSKTLFISFISASSKDDFSTKGQISLNVKNDVQTLRGCISSWNSRNGIFHKYLFDYFPKRYTDKQLDNDQKEHRKLIWDFKNDSLHTSNDSYKRALDLLLPKVEEILRSHFSEKVEELTLFCIPASTQEKNKRRYELFSMRLCESLGMENAYGHFLYEQDGQAKHSGGMAECVIKYDESFFRNKKIIMFDDIFTLGRTSLYRKNELESIGAFVIGLITIGKTIPYQQ